MHFKSWDSQEEKPSINSNRLKEVQKSLLIKSALHHVESLVSLVSYQFTKCKLGLIVKTQKTIFWFEIG